MMISKTQCKNTRHTLRRGWTTVVSGKLEQRKDFSDERSSRLNVTRFDKLKLKILNYKMMNYNIFVGIKHIAT